MIYTGTFKNIKNIEYQVDIIVNDGDNTTKEIMFSSEPFTIELNSNNTIFEPLKLSNSTCTIYSDSYNFNIYSSTAQGTKMILTNKTTNTIKWVGYVTPNILNMGWVEEFENIQIESIDGLSTLENYKFGSMDLVNKRIKSFEDLIIHIIKKCNCYTKIYVNENDYLNGFEDQKIIDKLLISEQNFFDDSGEPIKYKEVLTQLLQFLHYQIVADGDSVYIISYDYIKNGYTNYHTYSTVNNWLTYTNGYTTLTDPVTVSADLFEGTGANIELDTVYNQVIISTDIYTTENYIPDMFDDDNLTNVTKSGTTTTDWNTTITRYHDDKCSIYKFVNNKYYTTYTKINGVMTELTEKTFDNIRLNRGATLVKLAEYSTKETPPNSISFTDYILMQVNLPPNPTVAENLLEEFVKIKTNMVVDNALLYDDYYIILNCSALWDNDLNEIYLDDWSKLATDDFWNEGQSFLTGKLKIGNKYWDGLVWTTTPSTFKLQFAYDEQRFYFNWHEIRNEVYYDTFIDEKGLKIPILKTDNLVGSIEITLMSPQHIIDYTIGTVWIKDFSLKLVKPNRNKDDKTNTEYKNVINEGFVNEFSDLELKVCTDTDKGLNYSSVIQTVNSTTSYNKSIKTKSLGIDQTQEQNIIQSYVNQYSTPSKKLNITLGDDYKPYTLFDIPLFSGEKFIVDGMTIDVGNNTNEINLVSKK